MRFAVFTHVIHHQQNNSFFAYAPYVREMNIWFKNFNEVEIVAPLQEGKPDSELSYEHNNLKFTQIPAFNLLSFAQVLRSVVLFPVIFLKILKAMYRADHLHIRCPGNVGLLACLAQIFFPKKPKTVKYAGNWDPDARQPLSYKLQKKILNSPFLSKNIKVLVYGNWADMSKNIIPFFTASFSEEEKNKIKKKDFSSRYNFVFVGNLSPGKQPLIALKIVEMLKKNGIPVELKIYGSGEMEERLQDYISEKRLNNFISLKGKVGLEALKSAYKESHFVVLPSKSEGWPKALAEAMFFGCIPVATSVSCVPWMLDQGKRGIIIEDDEKKLNESAAKIQELIMRPEKIYKMSESAMVWSQEYSLEKFENGIKVLLKS